MKKQRILIIGTVFFAALFLFSGAMLMWRYVDRKRSANDFNAAASLIRPVEISRSEDFSETEDSTEKPDSEQIAMEKYEEVYEQNNDFVGWIMIEGTNINYPVMQNVDNPNFYLNHGMKKQYSNYGVPYVQENCMPGISDNVIIYGHHMKNGSMFTDLCKYEEEDFYQEHPVIRFDTLSSMDEYEIIAAFKTTVHSEDGFQYYLFVDAEDEDAFDTYVSQCKALALYDTGVDAEYGDKLLTLSTCEYSRKNSRMVIVARRIVPFYF